MFIVAALIVVVMAMAVDNIISQYGNHNIIVFDHYSPERATPWIRCERPDQDCQRAFLPERVKTTGENMELRKMGL
jgi:hypothetical protein